MHKVRTATLLVMRWPATWPISLATVVTGVLGVLTTAFAGLIIQDWWPGPADSGGFRPGDSTPARLGVFLLLAAGFIWVLYALSWYRRDRGTLFYLRLITRGQSDFHAGLARADAATRPAFRSLLHRVDLGGDGPVIDLRSTVESFSDSIANLIHQDDPATSTTVAPNMLFPVALAVGYDWQEPPDTILREFNGPRVPISTLIPQPFDLRLKAVHQCYQQIRQRTLADNFGTDLPGPAAPPAGVLWLDFHFTQTPGPTDIPTGIGPGFHAHLTHRVIGVLDGDQTRPRYRSVTAGPGPDDIDPATMAALMAWHIHDALLTDPHRPVAVTARVPKAVALAAGWQLRQLEIQDAATGTPTPAPNMWSRLYTFVYLQGHIPATRAAWVRYDQVNPAGICAPPP